MRKMRLVIISFPPLSPIQKLHRKAKVMNQAFLKSPLRQLYRFLINFSRIEWDQKQLKRSALVFAPHQDDETLGCGGTIIHKKQAGADLKIVFMTDGSKSHSHLITERELKNIRREEALAAAQKLGLKERDVIFLEVKDGTLDNNVISTIQRVSNIILDFLPPRNIYSLRSRWCARP